MTRTFHKHKSHTNTRHRETIGNYQTTAGSMYIEIYIPAREVVPCLICNE